MSTYVHQFENGHKMNEHYLQTIREDFGKTHPFIIIKEAILHIYLLLCIVKKINSCYSKLSVLCIAII
jgi:hypothetical protein